MSLVCRRFNFNQKSFFDCYIYIIKNERRIDEFWFNALDVSKFLEYITPNQVISDHVLDKDKRTWSTLRTCNPIFTDNDDELAYCTTDWEPSTMFINENGLYALINNKTKVIHFKD